MVCQRRDVKIQRRDVTEAWVFKFFQRRNITKAWVFDFFNVVRLQMVKFKKLLQNFLSMGKLP